MVRPASSINSSTLTGAAYETPLPPPRGVRSLRRCSRSASPKAPTFPTPRPGRRPRSISAASPMRSSTASPRGRSSSRAPPLPRSTSPHPSARQARPVSRSMPIARAAPSSRPSPARAPLDRRRKPQRRGANAREREGAAVAARLNFANRGGDDPRMPGSMSQECHENCAIRTGHGRESALYCPSSAPSRVPILKSEIFSPEKVRSSKFEARNKRGGEVRKWEKRMVAARRARFSFQHFPPLEFVSNFELPPVARSKPLTHANSRLEAS